MKLTHGGEEQFIITLFEHVHFDFMTKKNMQTAELIVFTFLQLNLMNQIKKR